MPEPTTPPIPRTHLHLALGVAGLALLGGVARYALQGTSNIYTNTSRAFYLEDPVIGWTVAQERWVWLGLEVLAIIAAIGVGVLVTWKVAGYFGRAYLDGRRGRGWLRAAVVAFYCAALAAAATPIVPVLAFASGLPPHGAEPHLPAVEASALPQEAAEPGAAPSAVTLPGIPAGTYTVLPHDRANTLIAQLAAGGEAFDATFSSITGELELEPADLAATRARVVAPAASIDTGIPLRSTHAKTDLGVEEHAELTLALTRVERIAAQPTGAVAFEAIGDVTLMGKVLELPISGTLKVLDADERESLAVDAEVVILVNATVTIPIAQTPLDASSFDRETIPVTARLLFAPAVTP